MSTGIPARDDVRAALGGSIISPPAISSAHYSRPVGKPKIGVDFIPLSTLERVMDDHQAYLGRGMLTLADVADEWNACPPPKFTRSSSVSAYLPPRRTETAPHHDEPTEQPLPLKGRRRLTRAEKQALNPRPPLVTATEIRTAVRTNARLSDEQLDAVRTELTRRHA